MRVVRKFVSLLLLCIVSSNVLAQRAFAAQCVTFTGIGDTISACYEQPGSPPSHPGGNPTLPLYRFPFATHIIDGDIGIICRAIWSTTSLSYANERRREYQTLDNLLGPRVRIVDQTACPIQSNPSPPPPHTSGLTNEQRVGILLRDQAQLPVPQLSVSPSHGIAGLPMRLVIDGIDTYTTTLLDATDGFSIQITLIPEVSVVWGDGVITKTDQHQLAHAYVRRGTFQLQVTVQWVAQWKATDGTAGELRGALQTAASVPNIAVDEAEAVLRQ